ncbi:hypothetical protein ACIGNX_30785 [Actinosynnema sp. NPDC053489]|uniref:P-loop NTPase n=1 Tax=Actinosynnema sp. NPDC053489 TaxID=3363916 RepID=UPI0037C780D5
MAADYADLIERLEFGPSFLMLGQRYLLMDGGVDPLSGPVSRAAELASDFDSLYKVLLTVPPARKEHALTALTESAAALSVPTWVEVVAGLPWNGVFSTAVDSLFVRALRNEWRAVQPVSSSHVRPPTPRKVSRVQAVLMYGGTDQPPEGRPPTNMLDLAARRAEANMLVMRLPDELITPRGVLVIEAWSVDDWFSPADMFAMLSRLGTAQAHLFSATSAELADPYIAAAIKLGVLVTHSGDFATYVAEARRRGRLTDRERFHSGRHLIRHDRTQHEVPREIWNAVTSFGRPIDLELLTNPPVQSEELRYRRFREFLGGESSVLWSAIGSGFAYERDYEAELRREIKSALSSRGLLRHPLLLSGQTGTGKSVALASLAYSIARDGQHAVLHIPRRINRPSFDAIDSFCEWAENMSMPTTLVVWDGMLDPDDYFTLTKFLDSRGRRAVLVGSCYRADDDERAHHVVQAPAALLPQEIKRFVAHLASFGIDISQRDEEIIQKDSSFLSALYRFLPETRGTVKGNLVLELRWTESELTTAAREGADYDPPTAMASALYHAGLIDSLDTALRDIGDVDDAAPYRGPYDRLINTVLVASRHGQSIPLELALRVVGRDGVRNLPQLLGKVDLIRWLENGEGNYTLSARNELEAQILVSAEHMSRESEIDAIAGAFTEVRPDGSPSGGAEVQFVSNLLERIGPQGGQEEYYAPYFLQIADAIEDANSASHQPSPRLTLAQVNLSREWVKFAQRKRINDVAERMEILEAVQEVAEHTLAHSQMSRGLRARLMVEHASVLGAQAYELLRSGADGHEGSQNRGRIRELAARVLQITAEAIPISDDRYYPVDVLCWMTFEILNHAELPSNEAAELLAECVSRMLLTDVSELSAKQAARYNANFAKLATLAGSQVLADLKWQELADGDEPLAVYLYALQVSGLIENRPNLKRIETALSHLRSHPAAMRDRRCLRLAMDLFWLARTGYRFMEGERLTLPLSRDDWEECLQLADNLQEIDDLSDLRPEFMRAIALFHLGRISAAFDAFRRTEQKSHRYRRRILAMYLASDPSGLPRKYHPIVRVVDPDNRKGACWLGDLGREVPFQPYDFGLTEPSHGLALPDSYITFNLRGPLLEPARKPGDKRGPTVLLRSAWGSTDDSVEGD